MSNDYADVIAVNWADLEALRQRVLVAYDRFGTLMGELHKSLRPMNAIWAASGSEGGNAAMAAEDRLAQAFEHYGVTLANLANVIEKISAMQRQNEIRYANAFGGGGSQPTAMV
jgi:hypothetical protein